MSAIAPTPFTMKDSLVRFGDPTTGDSYEKAIAQVELQPSSSAQTFQAVSPGATYTDQSDPTWGLVLTFAQDWNDPDSLSRYLWTHSGEEVVLTFRPRAGEADIFSATVIAVPGSVGGTGPGYATSTVTMGVQGQPNFTPETP